jgi:hypothetical protein
MLAANSLTFWWISIGTSHANVQVGDFSVEGGTTPMQGHSSWIMHRVRPWEWSTGTRRGADRRPQVAPFRAAIFDDVVLPVCFLALVGIVLVGGLLGLLSWVSAGIPPAPQLACSDVVSCAPAAAMVGDPGTWGDVAGFAEPTETR